MDKAGAAKRHSLGVKRLPLRERKASLEESEQISSKKGGELILIEERNRQKHLKTRMTQTSASLRRDYKGVRGKGLPAPLMPVLAGKTSGRFSREQRKREKLRFKKN